MGLQGHERAGRIYKARLLRRLPKSRREHIYDCIGANREPDFLALAPPAQVPA